MLHASLRALGRQAPRCASTAQARGVLAESLDLLRNGVDHDGDAVELVEWYSGLLTGVLACPAVTDLAHGTPLVPEGPLGRGEALPGAPVSWVALAAERGVDSPVREIFDAAGIPVGTSKPPVPRARLAERVRAALRRGDSVELPAAADRAAAGPELLDERAWEPLLEAALAARPASLRTRNGLPDPRVEVDAERDLVEPAAAVARWAGLSSGSTAQSTLARLAAAVDSGVLATAEAQEIEQAWRTGVHLAVHRWAEHAARRPVPLAELPAVQRSAYGACARGLAAVTDGLAARTRDDHPQRR